jgi:hypothetical protein
MMVRWRCRVPPQIGGFVVIAVMWTGMAAASPFTSNGTLSNLDPQTTVNFNTDTGAYSIDGVTQTGMGVPSTDPSGSTMLFNFTGIDIGSSVSVTAEGSRALGLLANQNVTIQANLNFAGGAGGPGGNGNGGGGGGGGAAARW